MSRIHALEMTSNLLGPLQHSGGEEKTRAAGKFMAERFGGSIGSFGGSLEPLPPLPKPEVTLTSEVVRLRGGPYWSMSYARLRPTSFASHHPEVSRVSRVFCVDHCTDGGRWILVARHESANANRAKLTRGRAPMKCLSSVGENVSCCVQDIGKWLVIDLEGLTRQVNKDSIIAEVRVFGCSLESRRVIHFKTSDKGVLERVMQDTSALALEAAAPQTFRMPGSGGAPSTVTHSLPGHERFAFHPKAYCGSASTSCDEIGIGLVWVRLRDGIVVATDQDDPSFLRTGDGVQIEVHPQTFIDDDQFQSKKQQSKIQQSKIQQSKKQQDEGEKDSSSGEASLKVLRQPTIDDDGVKMMVPQSEADLEIEVRKLRRTSRRSSQGSDETETPCCSLCEGTGMRWVAIRNTYGYHAGRKARALGIKWKAWRTKHNNETIRRMYERMYETGGDMITPMREFSFFASKEDGQKDRAQPEGNIYQESTQLTVMESSGSPFDSNDVVRDELGRVKHRRLRENLTAVHHEISQDEMPKSPDVDALNAEAPAALVGATKPKDFDFDERSGELRVNGKRVAPKEYMKCWVCHGRGILDRAPTTHMLRGNGGEQKDETLVVEEDNADDNDDVCLICWCDPPKFGISTTCTHVFCEECIKGHLKQIQSSGEFPGYCPVCQAAAPDGDVPRYGRITGPAMTFLQRKGLFDKEFQYRFMRQQNGDEMLFFACPNKCGNFLVDVDPTYIMYDGEISKKTERCPCGAGVCVQCHQLVADEQFHSHRCPEAKDSSLESDIATIQMMKKLGKKCPNCNMFIIKNQGCDIMMCGDSAHGDLRKAIKAGGCGQTFVWSTLKKIEDTITNFEGERVRCNPPVQYKLEILQKQKEYGMVVTDEELKIASLDVSTLEVINSDGHNGKQGPKVIPDNDAGKQGPKVIPDNDAKPGEQLVAINLRRPALEDKAEEEKMFMAIRHGNTKDLLKLIVAAHKKGQRIDAECRVWRETFPDERQNRPPDGPPLGRPGDFLFIGMFFLVAMILVVVTSFVACLRRRLRPRRTALFRILILFPFLPALIFLLVTAYGLPLYATGQIFVLYGGFFYTGITVWLHLDVVYNSPLTYACAYGNSDIVRVLLIYGADPNRPADSGMTPSAAAAYHGNWQCLDVLESSAMQQDLGAYTMSWRTRLACNGGEPGEEFLNDQQDRVKKRSKSWLTKYQLKANNQFVRILPVHPNEKLNAENCACSPKAFMHLACRCRRPRPRNGVEVERRNRLWRPIPIARARHAMYFCRFLGFSFLSGLLFVLVVWFAQGWFFRWKVKGFDYSRPGVYRCVRFPGKARWAWHDIQHVQMGKSGAEFATFSDRWLRTRHVDFDYRNVGCIYENALKFADVCSPRKTVVPENAVVCDGYTTFAASNRTGSATDTEWLSNSSDEQGSIQCVENCMPCNGQIGPFAESCSFDPDSSESNSAPDSSESNSLGSQENIQESGTSFLPTQYSGPSHVEARHSFGKCNAPVRAGDACTTKENGSPFFLQGAHTPRFTRIRVSAKGGACGSVAKAITFGMKLGKRGADSYAPDIKQGREGREELACLSHYFHQPAMVSVQNSFSEQVHRPGEQKPWFRKGGWWYTDSGSFSIHTKPRKNYIEATTDCKRRGGHLATVCTEAEEAEIIYSAGLLINVQLEHWTSHHTSWNEANHICKQSGSRMCTLAELCPSHNPGGSSEAAFRHPTKDDAWVPYADADAVDNWVQLGKGSDDRMCRTHQEINSGTNKPCSGNNIDPNMPACGPNHDSVFCCSGQKIDQGDVFLIGIHSSQQSWEWSEPGANCAYRNWAPSQGSGKNTCAGLRDDNYWHETACEIRQPYVCSYSDITKRTENEPGRVNLWYETTTPTVDSQRLRRRRLRRDLASTSAHPVVTEWSDHNNPTWNMAKRDCTSKGLRMCTLAELCPHHNPSGRSDPRVVHGTKPETWVPYSDHVDNWVQLGKDSGDRMCRTHQEAHGGNKPCRGQNVDPDSPVPCGNNPTLWCCLEDKVKNEFWGLSTWNVSTEVRNGRNTSRGCGWLQMTHVQPTTNVNLFTSLGTNNGTGQSSASLYMYTDRNGWLLSSKILDDLTVDPGPGVIFASSYRHSSSVLDYCDGVLLSNANDPNDAAIVTLSYKSEPLDNIIGYDPDKPGIYACAGPGIPQSPIPLDKSISFEIQSKSWRSNHTSWNEANHICMQSGSRMCTLAELCPSHNPGGRSEAAFRHPTKDYAWVPYADADAVDNWVQLGKGSHDLRCRTHQEIKKPCSGNNTDPNMPACGPNHDSVVCCNVRFSFSSSKTTPQIHLAPFYLNRVGRAFNFAKFTDEILAQNQSQDTSFDWSRFDPRNKADPRSIKLPLLLSSSSSHPTRQQLFLSQECPAFKGSAICITNCMPCDLNLGVRGQPDSGVHACARASWMGLNSSKTTRAQTACQVSQSEVIGYSRLPFASKRGPRICVNKTTIPKHDMRDSAFLSLLDADAVGVALSGNMSQLHITLAGGSCTPQGGSFTDAVAVTYSIAFFEEASAANESTAEGRECLAAFFSDADITKFGRNTTKRKGCGWVSLNVVNQALWPRHSRLINATIPAWIYTDVNGWVLTTKVLQDLNQDPGPGVIVASSFGDPFLGSNGPLDYCNGLPLAQGAALTERVAFTMTLDGPGTTWRGEAGCYTIETSDVHSHVSTALYHYSLKQPARWSLDVSDSSRRLITRMRLPAQRVLWRIESSSHGRWTITRHLSAPAKGLVVESDHNTPSGAFEVKEAASSSLWMPWRIERSIRTAGAYTIRTSAAFNLPFGWGLTTGEQNGVAPFEGEFSWVYLSGPEDPSMFMDWVFEKVECSS